MKACLICSTLSLGATPALSDVIRVSELTDINPNIWAYKALKELVEKYDVLEGYPDNSFKGDKPATRYEMAQALYELIKVVDLNKVEPSDAEEIIGLKKEFDKELNEVKARLNSLEYRVDSLEAEVSRGSWTDKIRVSGDLTNIAQGDWSTESYDIARWGTRARLGIDATLLSPDENSRIGDGIAHMRLTGGNGGAGTFGFATAGNNLNDVLFDSTNPGSFANNNSLYSGRIQDSRMNMYLEQAYYTQVLKLNPAKNRGNFPNAFAVLDFGQQDLWNTFHKSLVREDSLDGFINQRILHGVVGASDATTEAAHVGINLLGNGIKKDKLDECGNLKLGKYNECGEPESSLFQAISLDYAFAGHKSPFFIGDTNMAMMTNALISSGVLNPNLLRTNTLLGVNATVTPVWATYSNNLALNVLYDLPGSFFDTGLLTAGVSGTKIDYSRAFFAVDPRSVRDDAFGLTVFTKWEQFFGKNRTVGIFADYSFATNSSSNYLVNGPINQLIQGGIILNTTFMPKGKWNFNKDQIGIAYSFADPFGSADNNRTPFGRAFTISQIPTNAGSFFPSLYVGARPEQVIEAYYRKYITENISITPDIQVIFNGNGHNTGISGILRATFKLPNWNDAGAFEQFGYRDWSQRIAKYRATNEIQ